MRTPLRTTIAVVATAGLASTGLFAFSGASSASQASPLVFGLTSTDQIVQFRASAPGAILATSPVVPTTGDIEGIDIRPGTGELYGLVNNPGGADALVVINPLTGQAVRTIPLTAGTSGASPDLEGNEFGFDFNPAIDRIRVVSDTDANYVLNPDTGVIQARQPDLRRVGDPTSPDVRGAAYTNNIATPTSTVLFDIDIEGPDFLRMQSAAGTTSGELTTVGPTGTDVATPTVTAGTGTGNAVGFDIEARTDRAFAVLEQSPGVDEFSTVNLATGAATLVGPIGGPLFVEDITVASPRISLFPTGNVRVDEGSSPQFLVNRTGDLDDAVTLDVAFTEGTATGSDFGGSATRTVTIPAGATQTAVTVPIAADSQTEGEESFTLTLVQPTSPGNAALTRDRSVVVTINDTSTTFNPGGTPGGGGGTPTSPSPTASGSPSASASSSPSSTVSPSPSSPLQASRLGISVSPSTITPGVQSVVTVTGRPGTIIELLAYSRPNTQYGVVRRGTILENGTLVFRVLPGTNTRLFAAVTGQTGNESPSVVINVRTALSLTVVRNGSGDYTFQGRILPRRAGQLITLYRVESDGREIITSQIRTDNSGTYRIRRIFVGQGTFGFLTRTGQTLTNASGVSNGGRARPTAIYFGPQR